jgi:hypothetical protein
MSSSLSVGHIAETATAKTDESQYDAGHHGFRFHQYEGISPTRIQSPQRRPKESV